MGFKLVRTNLTGVYDSSHVDNTYLLDDKINYYLSWYAKNVEEFSSKELSDVIEKVTIWYELRYPDIYLDQGDIDPIMFKEVNFQGCNQQQWCDFYNFKKFYFSLSKREKAMLDRPSYPDLIYLSEGSRLHIHVDSDGTINDASDLWYEKRDGFGKYVTGEAVFNGHNISEMDDLAKENEINLNLNNIHKAVRNYTRRNSVRNGLFDSIMYRIIEKGGKYYGPRRGVLFAREFERNVDVPVSYGDAALMMEYLANDGDENLVCFANYFDDDKVVKKTVKEVLSSQNMVGMSNKQKVKVFPNTDI